MEHHGHHREGGVGSLLGILLAVWTVGVVFARAPIAFTFGMFMLVVLAIGVKPYHVQHAHDGQWSGYRTARSVGCVSGPAHGYIDGHQFWIVSTNGDSVPFSLRHVPGALYGHTSGHGLDTQVSANRLTGSETIGQCVYFLDLSRVHP